MKTLSDVKTCIHSGLIEDGMMADVGVTAFGVYMTIALHANWETGISYVGYKTIMKKTGIGSHHTIKASVLKLQQRGYMTAKFERKKTKAGRQYGRKQHIYILTLPANSEYDPSKIRKAAQLYLKRNVKKFT